MRRLVRPAGITLTLLFVAYGCAGPDASTPAACLDGAPTYRRALERAPGEVRLAGETPISDCLAPNQTGGDLATVGTAMVGVATRLNAEARADEPGGTANVALGYLLGAATRGAEGTEGIHAELIRRLTAAASYSPDDRPPPAFSRAYRRGYDAGQSQG